MVLRHKHIGTFGEFLLGRSFSDFAPHTQATLFTLGFLLGNKSLACNLESLLSFRMNRWHVTADLDCRPNAITDGRSAYSLANASVRESRATQNGQVANLPYDVRERGSTLPDLARWTSWGGMLFVFSL